MRVADRGSPCPSESRWPQQVTPPAADPPGIPRGPPECGSRPARASRSRRRPAWSLARSGSAGGTPQATVGRVRGEAHMTVMWVVRDRLPPERRARPAYSAPAEAVAADGPADAAIVPGTEVLMGVRLVAADAPLRWHTGRRDRGLDRRRGRDLQFGVVDRFGAHGSSPNWSIAAAGVPGTRHGAFTWTSRCPICPLALLRPDTSI